jgi:hypothetical protein
MLLELTANAIAAPISSTLGRKTGLSRDEMLCAIGTSSLWPDLSMRNTSGSTQDSVTRIQEVLGVSIPQWLRMQLNDRMNLVGLTPITNWVQIRADIDSQQNYYNLSVVSGFPPLQGDIEAIRIRFKSTDETSRRIENERKLFEDAEGIYHMPSFTGGGGMGLLHCIWLAKKNALYLDYSVQDNAESGVCFKLANHPIR